MHSKHSTSYINISSDLWTQQIWKNAEQKWISRCGQDHFYRDHVAIPGLVYCIKHLCKPCIIDIVDIGSGDGYFTNKFASEIFDIGFKIENICLLDLSMKQLEIATNREFLKNAHKVVCNFLTPKWAEKIPMSNNRRLYICVFVIQELHSLDGFMNGLSKIMKTEELAFILTIDPAFSELLAQKNKIISIIKSNHFEDWDWRGLYPIDGDAGRFYLPHFQRKIKQLKTQFIQNNLKCIYIDFLKVPFNNQNISIFSKTIYGMDILETFSSIIMVIKK